MYELIQLTEHCYYIESPAKIGLVRISGNEVVLIDSGNDKDAGKKVKRILDVNGWKLKAIYNTHSHADHIGGNKYLQSKTGCNIYANEIECCFTNHPILEPSYLYGGNPPKSLRHKFLMAKESNAEPLAEKALPAGLSTIPLPGHSFDMVGFMAPDRVCYIADCLSSKATLEKYQIGFLVNPAEYIETLEKVKNIDAEYFVPAHADVCSREELAELADINIAKVREIADGIADILSEPMAFDDLLKSVFEKFQMEMTLEQHALIGSTVRSYLTWLEHSERVDSFIDDNKLIYKKLYLNDTEC